MSACNINTKLVLILHADITNTLILFTVFGQYPSNRSSLMFVQYIDRKLLAAAIYGCSSLNVHLCSMRKSQLKQRNPVVRSCLHKLRQPVSVCYALSLQEICCVQRPVILASGLASAGQTFCTDRVFSQPLCGLLATLPSPSSTSIRRFWSRQKWQRQL